MAQSIDESKVNSMKEGPLTISRDRKPRDLQSETPLIEANQKAVEPNILIKKSDRREFFQSVIPASAKVLTEFLRSIGKKSD